MEPCLSQDEVFAKKCNEAHQLLSKLSVALKGERRNNSAEKSPQAEENTGNQVGLRLTLCPLSQEPDEVIPKLL